MPKFNQFSYSITFNVLPYVHHIKTLKLAFFMICLTNRSYIKSVTISWQEGVGVFEFAPILCKSCSGCISLICKHIKLQHMNVWRTWVSFVLAKHGFKMSLFFSGHHWVQLYLYSLFPLRKPRSPVSLNAEWGSLREQTDCRGRWKKKPHWEGNMTEIPPPPALQDEASFPGWNLAIPICDFFSRLGLGLPPHQPAVTAWINNRALHLPSSAVLANLVVI